MINMELTSKEESVIVHYKGGIRVAATFFNGKTETYAIEAPMGRTQYVQFFETNKQHEDKKV